MLSEESWDSHQLASELLLLDDMLNQVLEFKPDTWTYADYSNKRYVLVEVDPLTDEFREVTAPFKKFSILHSVEKVERIQNPYALGCYMIRKEQLATRGELAFEETCYHPLEKLDHKSTALEYNLDVRRYSLSKTQPQFYTRIDEIITQYDNFIVCKILNRQGIYGFTVTVSYETEYLAEYVVQTQKVE